MNTRALVRLSAQGPVQAQHRAWLCVGKRHPPGRPHRPGEERIGQSEHGRLDAGHQTRRVGVNESEGKHWSHTSFPSGGHTMIDEIACEICGYEQDKHPKPGSKYIGVRSSASKWVASIRVGGRKKHLGTFCSIEEAAHAYDQVALARDGRQAAVKRPRLHTLSSEETVSCPSLFLAGTQPSTSLSAQI